MWAVEPALSPVAQGTISEWVTALPETAVTESDCCPNQLPENRESLLSMNICVCDRCLHSKESFPAPPCKKWQYLSLTWTSSQQLFPHPYRDIAHFWLVRRARECFLFQWTQVGWPQTLPWDTFSTVFLASEQVHLHLIKWEEDCWVTFILLFWLLWLLCMSLPVCWLIQLHRRMKTLTANNDLYSLTLSLEVRFDATEHYWQL